MMQLSSKITVLSPGDALPQVTGDIVKIYLAGTEDMNPVNEHWQDKMVQGMVTLTEGPGAISVFKNKNWVFFNPMMAPQLSPIPNPDNPEWLAKKDWECGMLNAADGIFFNIQKKSVPPLVMFNFGLLVNSQKMVVRCSQEYANYGIVAYMCQSHGIPLLPVNSNVKDAIWALMSICPALQQNQQIQLPE
jgi:hypothetical protein